MGEGNSNWMGAASLAQAGSSLASNISQSGAVRSQGLFQKQQSDMNARISEMRATDAIERGNAAASAKIKQGKQVIGAQRAALAAQGIDIGVGSALEIQYDTKRIAEMDAITIKNNAWQEAWGYKVQALNDTASGNFQNSAANFASNNMLLTGGLNALKYGSEAAYYFNSGGKTAKKETG
jgi:hypothetical protein